MTDERKRALIHLMSKADRLQSKSSRGGNGWRPTALMYDKQESEKELTGEKLTRELRRQLAFTLPWLLGILLLIGFCVFALIMIFTH